MSESGSRKPASALRLLESRARWLGTLFLAVGVLISAKARAEEKAPVERIITLGGSITETVVALGAKYSIVAIDDSSAEVAETAKLPKVGYYRSIGAEGILSLKPTLVIGTTDAGPPPVLEQLRRAGVRLVLASADATVAGAKERVSTVAAALGKKAEGEALVAAIDHELDQAAAGVKASKKTPKVLFLFAPGQNVLSAAGQGTAAEEMLRLAGAANAVKGYQGYKPLSAEAAIAAAPEVILVTTSTVARLGGVDGILALPGLAATPAGKSRRVVVQDDLFLLGFGPRTGTAVKELCEQLHASVR